MAPRRPSREPPCRRLRAASGGYFASVATGAGQRWPGVTMEVTAFPIMPDRFLPR